MPENYITKQSAPSATTEDVLYLVPPGARAVISSYVVCNRGATATTWRISIAVGGGVTANKDYIDYDYTIPANESFKATIGATVNAGDEVRVYAGNANLSFTLFGSEIT
jgi:hypothetical protein